MTEKRRKEYKILVLEVLLALQRLPCELFFEAISSTDVTCNKIRRRKLQRIEFLLHLRRGYYIIRSTNFGELDSYYTTCIIYFLSVIGSKKMRNFEGVRSYYTFFCFLLEEQMRTSAQEL